MGQLREKGPLRTTLVCVLCYALVWLVYPKPATAGGGIRTGSRTSNEAGAPDRLGQSGEDVSLAGWKPSVSFFYGGSGADTTDLEFPKEDEEDRKHLVRDVGIFIVVSAFLAYFLVKVFLQGDEEEPPPDDGGKVIPGAASFNPAARRAW